MSWPLTKNSYSSAILRNGSYDASCRRIWGDGQDDARPPLIGENMQLVLHLIATYGYLVVMLVVMAESAGLPVPGETSLLVAGALAATGRLALPGVIIAAALGAILGDTAGYWVGRTSGLRLLRRYGRFIRFDERKLAQAETFFERHGEKTVFLGRFVPVGRIFSAVLAGVSQMRYSRFLFWNAAGGIVWATLMGTLGYLFGRQLPVIERLVSQFGIGLLIALVIFFAARFAWKRRAQIATWWAHVWAETWSARIRESMTALIALPAQLRPRQRWLLMGLSLTALSGIAYLMLT